MPELSVLLADDRILAKAVVLVFATLVAGFMRGFVGFGGAMVIIPVLTLLVGPLGAVAVAAVSGVPATIQLLPTTIRHSEHRFVVPLGLATFIAAPLGAWILVSVDPKIMKMVIALLVMAMVAFLAGGWRFARRARLATTLATGAAGGFIQGCAGVGGPPIVGLSLSRTGPPSQQRANVLAGVMAVSFSSMIPLWYHGLFTRDAVLLGLLLVPLNSAGTWVGARYFSGAGQQYFRRAALGILAAIGLVTFVLSMHDYLNA
jgi:uncharacterized membrane protein YfcA